MLTEQELNKIFNWLPFRDGWPVNRNQIDDGIEDYYGDLIVSFTQNSIFNSYNSQDGGMSNYIDFECYPIGYQEYSGPAISVLISLCAPVAAFGPVSLTISPEFTGHGFIEPEEAGIITEPELFSIKDEIVRILFSRSIIYLGNEFLSRPLSQKVLNETDHLLGEQYLHGIFQMAN